MSRTRGTLSLGVDEIERTITLGVTTIGTVRWQKESKSWTALDADDAPLGAFGNELEAGRVVIERYIAKLNAGGL